MNMALVSKTILYDRVEARKTLIAKNSKTVGDESETLSGSFSHVPDLASITADLPVCIAQYTVAGGANEDIDLTSLPVDQTAAMITTGVKWYYIALYNDSDNEFKVGNAGTGTECLAFATSAAAEVTLPAGQYIDRIQGGGVPIAGAKELRVNNTGGGTATFWIVVIEKTS